MLPFVLTDLEGNPSTPLDELEGVLRDYFDALRDLRNQVEVAVDALRESNQAECRVLMAI